MKGLVERAPLGLAGLLVALFVLVAFLVPPQAAADDLAATTVVSSASISPASSDGAGGASGASAEVDEDEPSVVEEPHPVISEAWTQRFEDDIATLTQGPHRLAGSEPGRAAGRFIEERLRAVKGVEVFVQDLPVWQQVTRRCELRVNGSMVSAWPLRPNVIVPPNTPMEGLSGKLLYVGQGDLADYAARDPRGAIVVLDYDSDDQWEQAFALGAAAVVFLGGGGESPELPKHAQVPSNQVRVYVDASAGVDLKSDHADATLKCQVVWEQRVGRNIVGRIKGTEPVVTKDQPRPEALILTASYDTFGVVPELTPGARGAANVAGLLAAAQIFADAPPKRDTLFAFLDNEARGHQGARELYTALLLGEDESGEWLDQRERELEHARAMLELLRKRGLAVDVSEDLRASGVSVPARLVAELRNQADNARDDVRKALSVLRLRKDRSGSEAHIAELQRQALSWDDVRRALHEDSLPELARAYGQGSSRHAEFGPIFEQLEDRLARHLERRVQEVTREVERGRQRQALRKGLGFEEDDGRGFIALHASLDFSDGGSRWGVVVGDWTQQLFAFRPPKTEADTPGYYGRILNAFRDVARNDGSLDPQTLSDPSLGLSFAPGPFVQSGAIAGAYGIYNVALMTGYDRRLRDGHPSDTVERLDLPKFARFASEGAELLRRVGSATSLSVPRVFKDLAINKLPGWDDGLSTGDYAGLTVSGSLSENRPASSALMALWPGQKGWLRQAWVSLGDANVLPSFDPLSYEIVDENGRFRVLSFREDMHTEVMTLGALFDETGAVRAISTTEHQAQSIKDSMRVNLFSGVAGRWTSIGSYEGQPGLLKLLKASSDSYFRDNRTLWGQQGNHGFFYISDQIVDYRVKVFEPMGEAVLGSFGDDSPYGSGVEPDFFTAGNSVARESAVDLWTLNESRLRKLRTRGVTSADLEVLHGRALRARERADEGPTLSIEDREASWLKSAALSQRVYLPLRQNMDDLVHAIVMLLLLSIPFAFALERLLICATTIYGRIGGFSLTFLATFALLYWMHPGFAIASTPMIIFLAFAIVLLSALVIYIVVRKFKTELRMVQGQGAAGHQMDVSRAGTLLAAVGMGMSTMRRRPTRTFLTATTVVILTFTILSFASFSQTVGVRSIYEGPRSEQTKANLLVRKLDYSEMPAGVLSMLRGSEGEGGLLAPQYWLARKQANAPRLTVAKPETGESLTLDAVMGVDPREVSLWPQLAEALGRGSVEEKRAMLERGSAFLPSIVAEVLGLRPGDTVLIGGRPLEFAATLDGPATQRLEHLDGQSLLPVDFQDAASLTAADSSNDTADENDLLLAEEVDREFVHLSGDQVVIASADAVRRMGGGLHLISVHTGKDVDVVTTGKRLAELVVMPVWASGEEGVERLLLTVLTGVSGGFALFVPLLLGGLIIFGTLLGSISDREKEIYTFSALGLSPGHVGVLFFAEAAVYAVVGGMGGQLLAQLVGLLAAKLAEAGLIQPASINYSSTNSLFAIAVVMATVLVSAIYPAMRASRSANPGLARSWKMPPAEGDRLDLVFPFTVSAYDITGVVSFLAEHFRRHDDAGLGHFAATHVEVGTSDDGNLRLQSELALAPFDLGVTQTFVMTAVRSEIEGVDEVAISVRRSSGARSDWYRANKTFLKDLRTQFLLWRTLSSELIEQYRQQTLILLGQARVQGDDPETAPPTEGGEAVPTLGPSDTLIASGSPAGGDTGIDTQRGSDPKKVE